MPRIIVFEVNETLLDLGVLDELFERHLGNTALRPLWFTQVVNTAMTAGCGGALITRPGQVTSPYLNPPDIVASNIAEVADKIIAAKQTQGRCLPSRGS
ncbi:MAG: hypothetical protein QF554_00470 [Dehalococcoidia bacterium]|jgi:microcystin degradation protein MlrC|nr:hypothetical protein [Dehalococcoidia bacterium]